MLVIIEGPDGSGKTTLCNRLRADLGVHALFLRSNGPPPSAVHLAQTLDWMVREAPPRLNLITDRLSLLSELVYGPELRGECMHDFQLSTIAQYLLSSPQPAMIIYCCPPPSALEESVQKEEQREGVIKTLQHLTLRYDVIMSSLRLAGVPVISYDFTQHLSEDVTQTVQEFFCGQTKPVPLRSRDRRHSEDASEIRDAQQSSAQDAHP